VVRKVIPVELVEFENRYFCMICVNLKLVEPVVVELFNYKGG
jgi:hypothetical protein